ncbi:MAG: D-hexose-6-phosphate mutarotase [Planctomycetota bacterium]
MSESLADLQRFASPGVLTIDTGCGGMPRVSVATALGRLEVYLHGGHVTAWQPAGHAPVLWMSSQSLFKAGKPIRGGIPLCWPWFGAAAEADKPAHGTIRNQDWELSSARIDDAGVAHVELFLRSNADTKRMFAHDFEVRLLIQAGRRLDVALVGTNTGSTSFTVGEALHTYLTIGDIRRTHITGLADAVGLNKCSDAQVSQPNPLTFSAETDSVYASAGPIHIHDPVLGRVLRIGKSGSNSTVVWNPWIAKSKKMPDYGDHEWPGMVCVEAANAGEAAYQLAPGESHRIATTIEVI